MNSTDDDEPTSLFGRFVATLIGGVAGALFCITWNIFDSEPLPDRESLSAWSRGMTWFVIGGASAGALGGVPLARTLWNEVLVDFRFEAKITLVLAVVFVIVFAIIR